MGPTPTTRSISIDLWCNGSTTGFGPVSSRSNRGGSANFSKDYFIAYRIILLYFVKGNKIMKITLSRAKWEEIGNKYGWLRTAITKGEAAKEIYGEMSYDHALPQSFVDDAMSKGFDVVGHFVWIYPQGSLMGMPGPITTNGLTMLGNPSFVRVTGISNNKLPDGIDWGKLVKI